MTNHSLETLLDIISRDSIGLVPQFETVSRSANPSFPPHNIIDAGDGKYFIELAIAGYSKDDVSIVVEDGKLKITGGKEPKDVKYLHRGIAFRNFYKQFILQEHVEVVNAEFKNGMLIIHLALVVPEHKKPRLIAITDKS